MKFKFGKNKTEKPDATPSAKPLERHRKVGPDDLARLLAEKRNRKIRIISGIVIILLVVVAGLYFLLVKPYREAMRLVSLSESQVEARDYENARRSLARARLIAPFLKSLYYREGKILLLQMNYGGAEAMFNEEITKGGFIAGSEMILGFLNTVDNVLSDPSIGIETKKTIIEELSNVLEIDIALDPARTSLNLGEGGYSAASSHFSRSMQADKDFESAAYFGLAYVNALRGEREAGLKSYAQVASAKDRFPTLAKFYEGIEPRLGIGSAIAQAPEKEIEEGAEEKMPEIGVGDLPPIPDDFDVPSLPNISMPSPEKSGRVRNPLISKREPTVKPFKLNQYQSKTGEMKYIVTLLNIRDRGQTVAREGQRREMPYTHVEILVVKLSEDEIIIKENDLYTFKWYREGSSWAEKKED